MGHVQYEYAKSDWIYLRIRWPKWSGFDPIFDDLGHQLFKSEKGMASILKMLSTTVSSSRAIDELDGDLAIWRGCSAPHALSAGGASFPGQTAVGWCGRGPGL